MCSVTLPAFSSTFGELLYISLYIAHMTLSRVRVDAKALPDRSFVTRTALRGIHACVWFITLKKRFDTSLGGIYMLGSMETVALYPDGACCLCMPGQLQVRPMLLRESI